MLSQDLYDFMSCEVRGGAGLGAGQRRGGAQPHLSGGHRLVSTLAPGPGLTCVEAGHWSPELQPPAPHRVN